MTIQFDFSDQLPGGAGQQVHSARAAVPSSRLQLIFGVFITRGTGIHTSGSETNVGHLEVLLSKVPSILMHHSENCLFSWVDVLDFFAKESFSLIYPVSSLPVQPVT